MKIFDIIAKKVRWPDMDHLPPVKYQINRWIEKLDSLSVEYEARWGVNVLPGLVPIHMAEAWQRQMQKLNDAIEASDINRMADLVNGTERGYAAMEAAAIEAGHKPHGAPVAWNVRMPSGRELAIVATHHDAAVLQGNLKRPHELVIWSLQEIANFIDARANL